MTEPIANIEHANPSPVLPGVLIIGTLDTKGPEVAFIAAQLEHLGCRAVVLDAGILGEPTWRGADYSREDVASHAGRTLAELRILSRGEAMVAMATGVKVIALALARSGVIEGAICVAGAGVSLAVPAFQALDLGFPKMLVTPLASGSRTFGAFVGNSDVAVLHSVADIMGINAITEPVYVQSAGYISGAVHARRQALSRDVSTGEEVPLIAVTMNGNTTPALMYAKERLAAAGVEIVAFHANGTGGRAMEELAERGLFRGVLDYTITELGGHAVGGLMDAGASRLQTAGRLGLPQLIAPGCLDLITTGGYEETVRDWPGRILYRHNPAFTLVRLTREEMQMLGRCLAAKANAARGPVHICVPLLGYSVPNHPDGPFWDPDADAAFVSALKEAISPSIEVECVDAHINDVVFVDRVVDVFLMQLAQSGVPLATQLEMTR